MSKSIILNASPRKNWNTAQMLESVQKGAEAVGAGTEYYNLYDLQFTGCRSCMACKRKGAEKCRCYWKDELSPVLDKIFHADSLVIGSPVYLGDITSRFHALLERLHFCMLSYDDYSSYFTGKVDVVIIITMNATMDFYRQYYEHKFRELANQFQGLHGDVLLYPCCGTMQVKDYSKYDMASFQEDERKKWHETQFPVDLKEAYAIGEKIGRVV